MGVPYVVDSAPGEPSRTGPRRSGTTTTYLDLDAEPTGPKLGSRRELVSERGAVGGTSVDVVELRYDAFGNRNVRTPSPTGGERSTLLCYDGDGGWCPSPQGTFTAPWWRSGIRLASSPGSPPTPAAGSARVNEFETPTCEIYVSRHRFDLEGKVESSLTRFDGIT